MPEKEKASLAGEARRGGTINTVTLPRSLAVVKGADAGGRLAASDAEVAAARAALGAVLQDPAFAWPFVKDLPLERFPLGLERHVAEAMHSLTRRGAPIDLVSVVQEVTDTGVLDACGGAATVCELTNAVPTSANIEYYTQRLRELSNPRILGSLLSYSFKKASEPGADVPGITAALVETLTAEFAPRAAPDWSLCDTEAWATEAAPPIEWTFEGMLSKGELGMIAAAGGLGKTWLALLLGLSAATGRAILPAFRPVRPFKTLLLLGEDSEPVLWRRFRAIPRFDAEPELRRENFHVIAHRTEPLVAYSGGNPVRTPRWQWLHDHIDREEYEFVVVDPLARWHSVDENDAAAMTTLAKALEALTETGTVLVLHHIRKSSQGTLESEAARGSSALRDAVRWLANLAPISDGEARVLGADSVRGYAKLDISKANNIAALPAPIVLKRGPGGCLEQVDVEIKFIESMAAALGDWLAEHPEASVNLRALRRCSRTDCRGAAKLTTDLKSMFGRRATKERIGAALDLAIQGGSVVVKIGDSGAQELSAPWHRIDRGGAQTEKTLDKVSQLARCQGGVTE